MPALLLQIQQRQISKSKDYLNALERRLQKEDMKSQLFEEETIHIKLASILQLNNNTDLSRKLANWLERVMEMVH